jgi:hypothetical protein
MAGISCFFALQLTKKSFQKNHVFKEKGGAVKDERGFLQSYFGCPVYIKCGACIRTGA